MNGNLYFIEQTLFIIFLWIGIWGIVDVILDHTHRTTEDRIKIYIMFILISFLFLFLRGHTNRLAVF